jgi:uncharacterized protein YndB with AHSA1/START domain
MLKWALLLVGVLAALMLLPMVGGMFVARSHVAASTVTLDQPVDSLWAVVSDLSSYPIWWPDVRSMEPTEVAAGRTTWLQRDAQGRELPIEVVVSQRPHRFVTRIADERLPFSGTWTYEMEPTAAGSRLTVTEEGEIFNPVFRIMARYFLGYHGTIDRYIEALGSHFGETVMPVHLR